MKGGGWRLRGNKKKFCPFEAGRISEDEIHYLNYKFLGKYVTETGKIVPARITGLTKAYQKKICQAIKLAREIGLMPFSDRQ